MITGSKPKPNKGKLVKSKKLDYRNIMWPRDALYISYKDDKFEYINDLEAQDEPTYYCDCCDPARQKKRAYSDGRFLPGLISNRLAPESGANISQKTRNYSVREGNETYQNFKTFPKFKKKNWDHSYYF